MFTYTYNGHTLTRDSMAAEFGWRKLTDVIEVIAAGNGSYQAGAFRVTYSSQGLHL